MNIYIQQGCNVYKIKMVMVGKTIVLHGDTKSLMRYIMSKIPSLFQNDSIVNIDAVGFNIDTEPAEEPKDFKVGFIQ